VSGLAVGGSTVTIDLSCSATLDDVPVPLGGLVMADAEQSASNEYIEATIPADATWRILDRFRSDGCSFTTNATLSAGNTMRLDNSGLCPVGPMAVAYMDGTSQATVSIKGGGTTIIALGVVLNSDFGDAPASYGSKGAVLAAPVEGGAVPVGTTAVSGDDFALATLGQSAPRLGATVTPEGAPASSARADAHGGDDGVTLTATPALGPNQSYTIPGVACTGPGSVRGWFDWDRDGTFGGPNEASAIAPCAAGTASLTWTTPAVVAPTPVGDPTFVRIAIGPDAAALASPTGMMTAGEVEDHAIAIVGAAALCEARVLGLPLNLNVAHANPPETPCATRDATVKEVTELLSTVSLIPALNSSVSAGALLSTTTSEPGVAAAHATAAVARVKIPTLALDLQVTGVDATARSEVGACSAPAVLTGTSSIASLRLNGVTIPVGDQSLSIPLVVGALHLNQRVVSGSTIIRRTVFLDLPGTALDVIIGEAKAGAACAGPSLP
jgi:hypothetical protein